MEVTENDDASDEGVQHDEDDSPQSHFQAQPVQSHSHIGIRRDSIGTKKRKQLETAKLLARPGPSAMAAAGLLKVGGSEASGATA